MGTSKKQSLLRKITRIINRLFFRRQRKQNSQSYNLGTFNSFQKEVNHSHTSYHGDEESFWFI